MLDFKTTKNSFLSKTLLLRRIEDYINNLSNKNIKIKSRNLSIAASRITVPQPFYPYIKYIEERTKKEFPSDLYFTIDEVRQQDRILIDKFSTSNFDFSKLNLDLLIKASIKATQELGICDKKHVPISVKESAESFPNNTSSGFPIFKRKDNFTSREDAISWTKKQLEKGNLKEFLSQPTAVFHRFQYKAKIIGEKTELSKKIRPVWGVSYRILTFEGMFFRSIVDSVTESQLRLSNPISPTGRTKKQISDSVIKNLRTYKSNIVSVDYSLFDSYVPSFMWSLFYSNVEQCIEFRGYNSNSLDNLMVFHCFTPYCWNSTILKFQRRGVPSGCLITNLFDTWVNRVIINYAFLEYNKNSEVYPNSRACCLGDDLIFVEQDITYSHFLNVTKRFGMVLQIEKSSIYKYNEPLTFIGYNWDIEDRPTQSIEWYIAHLCMPSRFFRNYPFPVSVLQTYRGISICMSLFGGMNMFEYLVGWADTVYIELKHKYNNQEDPLITYVGEDMRYYGLRIPMSVIFNEGWESL